MLSMVIPVYNVERYLRECVDSVLRQTYTDWECILVDDGSTDASGAICDAYAARDARIRLIHQPNGGSSAARISGIRAARGEFLAFVDSDDWVEPDLFSRLLAPMLDDDSIDVSAGGYVTDTDGRISSGVTFVAEPAVFSPVTYGHRMFSSLGFNWSLCGKIYRQSLFTDDAMLAAWPHSYGEDTYINYQLLRRIRRAAYVPVKGYHYCMHAASMMHQGYQSGKMAYFEIYDAILRENRERDEVLFREILQLMMKVGTELRETAMEDERHDADAERMRQYLVTWRPEAAVIWSRLLDWQWSFSGEIAPEAFRARKQQWVASLRGFSQKMQRLYLYGRGVIGKYYAAWLDDLGIPWEGFIETHPQVQEDQGKAVISLAAFLTQDEPAGVLIAMNERHTGEVLPLLAGKTEGILEGWRMCRYGRDG